MGRKIKLIFFELFKFLLVVSVIVFKHMKLSCMITDEVNMIVLNVTYMLVFLSIVYYIYIRGKNINIFLLIIALTISVLQMVYFHDQDIAFLFLISLYYANDKKFINKIVVYYTFTLICIFIISIILSNCGILKSMEYVKLIGDTPIHSKSFGLLCPNVAYFYFFMICSGLYYIFRKYHLQVMAIILVLSYIMFYNTACRTGLVCSFVLLFVEFFYAKNFKLNKFAFIIGSVITISLAYLFYSNKIINTFFSDRPLFFHYYLSNGVYKNILGSVYNYKYIMDNIYLGTVVYYGMIIYFYYLLIFTISGKYIEKNRTLTKILIVFLIYGVSEGHIINIGLDFVLAIVGIISIRSNKEKL